MESPFCNKTPWLAKLLDKAMTLIQSVPIKGRMPSATLRAYSFGHLLKTVELVEDKILFFWYPSTENGRLRRLQIAFCKSLFFLLSVDFREIFDVFVGLF